MSKYGYAKTQRTEEGYLTVTTQAEQPKERLTFAKLVNSKLEELPDEIVYFLAGCALTALALVCLYVNVIAPLG